MTPRADVPALASVFAGGALGGLLRWAIDSAFAWTHPWEIVAVNVAGSAMLGVFAAVTAKHPRPRLYAFAGPGLLGGFTTFSGLAAFAWTGADAAGSVALLLGCVAGSVAAAAAGWIVGTRAVRGGDATPVPEVVP